MGESVKDETEKLLINNPTSPSTARQLAAFLTVNHPTWNDLEFNFISMNKTTL